MSTKQLPIPTFFDRDQVSQIWQVPYAIRAAEAAEWALRYNLSHVSKDSPRICLMVIDGQNTFCIPTGELFVAGRSGNAAVEDNVRLCEFIYRNLGVITQIAATMDTHYAHQIFHPAFWVDGAGNHPDPYTFITRDDVYNGIWKVNPAIAYTLVHGNYAGLDAHVHHYVDELTRGGKYALTIWPYHAMLGGVDHALVASVHEAIFFHSVARNSRTNFQIKGGNALTENYSVLKPEVLTGSHGQPIGQRNSVFIETLLEFDVVIIAGQAKSHCVAWTIEDLLTEISAQDRRLAEKVWLLEDCSSPVVVPAYDYTDDANAAYERFAQAGMHVVRSTDPIESWPGISL